MTSNLHHPPVTPAGQETRISHENVQVEDSSLTCERDVTNQHDGAISLYSDYQLAYGEAVKVGLYGDDLRSALEDIETLSIDVSNGLEILKIPVLVPIESLEWYNIKLLKQTYGDSKIYYFAHPPLTESDGISDLAIKIIKDKLDDGAVIITDEYDSKKSFLTQAVEGLNDPSYSLDAPTGSAKVYVGDVTLDGISDVQKCDVTINDIYNELCEKGELDNITNNGITLVESVDDDEAELLWTFYSQAFSELSQEDVMYAGFDKEHFFNIMKNPAIAKIIKHVDGEPVTLLFFLDDFTYCPWFNQQYYADNYPDYYNTGNILLFPGIVTDENARGSNYSMDLMNFGLELYKRRGSNALITFECTHISSQYIPKIVSWAFNSSSIASVTGLSEPVSASHYVAARKKPT